MQNFHKYLVIFSITLKCGTLCAAATPSSAAEVDGSVPCAPKTTTELTETVLTKAQTPPSTDLLDSLETKDLSLMTVTEKTIASSSLPSTHLSTEIEDPDDPDDPILEHFILRRKVTGPQVEYFKTYPHIACPVKIYSALIEDGALRLAGNWFHFYKIRNPQGKIAHMLGTIHDFPTSIFLKIVMECLTQASTVMIERRSEMDVLLTDIDKQTLKTYVAENIVGDLDLSDSVIAKRFAQQIKTILGIEVNLTNINWSCFSFLASMIVMSDTLKNFYLFINNLHGNHDLPMDTYYAWHAYIHSKPLLPLESLASTLHNIPPKTLFIRKIITAANAIRLLQELDEMAAQPITDSMKALVDNYKLLPLSPLFVESELACPLLKFINTSRTKSLLDWIAHRNLQWVPSIKTQMIAQKPDQTTFIAGGKGHMQIMPKGYIPTDMPQLLLSEGFKVSRYNAFTGQWTAVLPLETEAAPALDSPELTALETSATPASGTSKIT